MRGNLKTCFSNCIAACLCEITSCTGNWLSGTQSRADDELPFLLRPRPPCLYSLYSLLTHSSLPRLSFLLIHSFRPAPLSTPSVLSLRSLPPTPLSALLYNIFGFLPPLCALPLLKPRFIIDALMAFHKSNAGMFKAIFRLYCFSVHTLQGFLQLPACLSKYVRHCLQFIQALLKTITRDNFRLF